HYCASKAGVIMLTRALAKAFAPQITVNSVAPGVIPFDDIDERGKRMIKDTPARRGGTPDEIADSVVYFLTASNFVTGQTLAGNGISATSPVRLSGSGNGTFTGTLPLTPDSSQNLNGTFTITVTSGTTGTITGTLKIPSSALTGTLTGSAAVTGGTGSFAG